MNAVAADFSRRAPVGPPRVDWPELDAHERNAVLARPKPMRDAAQISAVRAILADVRARGDIAVREATLRFDRCDLSDFAVTDEEFAAADAEVGAELRAAMRNAIARVEAFHAAQIPAAIRVDTAPGVRCEQLIRPIGRVGLYVPAGSAPLPSTGGHGVFENIAPNNKIQRGVESHAAAIRG